MKSPIKSPMRSPTIKSPSSALSSKDQDSFECSRRELLSPLPPTNPSGPEELDDSSSSASWKLNINEFRLPQRGSSYDHPLFSFRRLCAPSNY